MSGFDWAGERVLVTGAGGVLGAALLSTLADIPSLRKEATFSPRRADCNLLDGPSVTRLFSDIRPTLVFHLAGQVSGIQGNISFAGDAYYRNALINLNVIEAARLANVRKIVAAGTTAIYPDGLSLPMREEDIRRGAPHGSEAAYASAKLGMLSQLEAYNKQYGTTFSYLVCTNLYGPHDRFDEQYGHVVPSLISRFYDATRSGVPTITVWGDGTPTRDFLHATDAAQAFVRSAESLNGVANVATGLSRSIRELVQTIADTSGFGGRIEWDSSKPNGQLARSYSVERIFATGWRPKLSLRQGIEDTYRWFMNNHDAVRR